MAQDLIDNKSKSIQRVAWSKTSDISDGQVHIFVLQDFQKIQRDLCCRYLTPVTPFINPNKHG